MNTEKINVTETKLSVEALLADGWIHEAPCALDEINAYVAFLAANYPWPQEFTFKNIFGSAEIFSRPKR